METLQTLVWYVIDYYLQEVEDLREDVHDAKIEYFFQTFLDARVLSEDGEVQSVR